MKSRRIAICVRNWGSEDSVYCWTWARSQLLQAKDQLAWSDHVYIVHVASARARQKEKWDIGGPTVSDVTTAVTGYDASIVELQGDPATAILEFVDKANVDILVVGSKGRRPKLRGGVTEYILPRACCPVLVARNTVTAGESFRMKAAASSDTFGMTDVGVPVRSPRTVQHRRIAVVYESLPQGSALLSWAAQSVVGRQDTILLLQCMRKRRTSQLLHDGDDVRGLVRDHLQGFGAVLCYRLQGVHLKSSVCKLAEREGVDLVICGRGQKGSEAMFAGRRSLMYMATTCPCPCLMLPDTLGGPAPTPGAPISGTASATLDDEASGSGSEDEAGDEVACERIDIQPGSSAGLGVATLRARASSLPSQQGSQEERLAAHVRHVVESGQIHLPGNSHFLLQTNAAGQVHSISRLLSSVATGLMSPKGPGDGQSKGPSPSSPSSPRQTSRPHATARTTDTHAPAHAASHAPLQVDIASSYPVSRTSSGDAGREAGPDVTDAATDRSLQAAMAQMQAAVSQLQLALQTKEQELTSLRRQLHRTGSA